MADDKLVQQQLDGLIELLRAQNFDRLTPEYMTALVTEWVEQNTDLSTDDGTILNIVLSPFCYVAYESMQAMRAQMLISFVTADSGVYIDQAAAAYGISRKPGTRASVAVKFVGATGTIVPAGTAVLTATGLSYSTTAACTIGAAGTATVQAEAADAGARYNCAPGAITTMATWIDTIVSVTNEAAATGGTDPESDAALFDRLDARRKEPVTSGNEKHYRQWALEVPGIGAAVVMRLWNGPGTVKVIVADSAMHAVTDALVQKVKNRIEDERPVTAEVTVVSAEGVPMTIAATAEFADDVTAASVKQEWTDAISAYFGEVAMRGKGEVVYNRVCSLLMDCAGVNDFTALTINGQTENIPLAAGEIPMAQTVTVEVASGA